MIILGVNGGGTGTEAIACDEHGSLIGTGSAGGSNYYNVGLAAAAASIRRAVRAAGVRRADAACFALASVDTESSVRKMTSALRGLARSVIVDQDAFGELYGETGGGPGVMVVAGTGSVVLGYDGRRRYRASGCGYLLGDDGSGYSIGREGLRAAFRVLNAGSRKTVLTRAIMASISADDLDDMVAWAYANAHAIDKIAALQVAVDRACAKGDREAEKIMDDASTRLAGYAVGIAGRAGVRLVHVTGGVFKSYRFKRSFFSAIRAANMRVAVAQKPKAFGALLMAAHSIGIDTSSWSPRP